MSCSAKGDLDHDELLFFLTGGVGLQNTMSNPTDKSWLSDRSWDEICRMSALPSFKGFTYVLLVCIECMHEVRHVALDDLVAWCAGLFVRYVDALCKNG